MGGEIIRRVSVILGVIIGLSGCGGDISTMTLSSPSKLSVAVVGSNTQAEAQREINEVISRNMRAQDVVISTNDHPVIADHNIVDVAEELSLVDAPDIIVVPNRRMAILLYEHGMALDLKSILDRGGIGASSLELESIHQSARLIVEWDHSVIGVPRTIDPLMILYNISHFERAGVSPDPNWDWEDFVEVAQRIQSLRTNEPLPPVQRGPRLPNMSRGAVSICHSRLCWQPFLMSHGGGYIDDDLTTITIDSNESREALVWFQELYATGGLINGTQVLFPLLHDLASFGPGNATHLAVLNETEERYAALPFPRSPSTNASVTVTDGSIYVINAASPNVELALDFLMASLATEVHEFIPKRIGEFAVGIDSPSPEIGKIPPPDVMNEVLQSAKPLPPPLLGGRHINEPMRSRWETILNGTRGIADLVSEVRQELLYIVDNRYNPVERDFDGNLFGATVARVEQRPPSPNFSAHGGIELSWLSTDRALIPLVEAFNDQSDHIHVTMVFPQSGVNYRDFVVRGIEESTIDLVTLGFHGATDLVDRDLLVQLDRLLELHQQSISVGGILEQVQIGGGLFVLPIQRFPAILFAKKSIWERVGRPYPEAGWTWEEFLDWASTATSDTYQEYGFVLSPMDWKLSFYQYGGRLVTGPYEAFEEVLPLIRALGEIYPSQEPFVRTNPSIYDVVEGKSASVTESHSVVGRLPYESVEEAGLIALPMPTPLGTLQGIGLVGTMLGVSINSEHLFEAVEFLRWVLSTEGSIALATQVEGSPVPIVLNVEVREHFEALLGHEAQYVLPEQYSIFTEIDTVSAALERAAYELIHEYLDGELSVEEAVESIRFELTSIVNETVN